MGKRWKIVRWIYRSGVSFVAEIFRKLGQEGYLVDDIFVDQRTQMNEKLLEGRYFCMIYQRTDIADQQKEIYVKDPDRIYMAVDGPKNSHGDDPVLPTTSINGWTITLVSKTVSIRTARLRLWII